MPIVIKEVYVKTTVEKNLSGSTVPEETLIQLKKQILKELQEKNERKTTWEKER